MYLVPLIVLFICIAYLAVKVYMSKEYEDTLPRKYKYRIHVNGIRGKSSVTRLTAAALREGGIRTLAKTTGTSAKVIFSHTREKTIPRVEPNIREQQQIIKRYRNSGYKALVAECMAINPIYQNYLETKIMKSTIGVITNVREDHMDQMGETLPEIARSLSNTIPFDGHLVTAEKNPEILRILEEECRKRGDTRLHTISDVKVKDEEMAGFSHLEYKDNVAVVLIIAEFFGIERSVALRGMYKALPDPGAVSTKKHEYLQFIVYWVNMFAVNDKESFILTYEQIEKVIKNIDPAMKKVVILNNRRDKPDRVNQFVDIVVKDVDVDYIVAFGDYESQVERRVSEHRRAKVKVILMGEESEYKNASGEELVNEICKRVNCDCLLVGAVNIHTRQATALLEELEGKDV